uniref:Purple acid phosphatase n=1 Tax=Tetranychus truncatus TaxID=93132 RepID=A0A3G5AQL2_9ACAR|nr:Iron/zinc purple acid phosphatase-like protein [Tetranychus truncatus]
MLLYYLLASLASLTFTNGFKKGLSISTIYQQPEQVHISLGVNPSEMIVTWTTFDPISLPSASYGISTLNQTTYGYSTKFVDGGSEKRVMYIHRVTMNNLKPDQKYVYRVGSEAGWSEIFWFKTIKDGVDWSPTFAVFGDLGNDNGKSIPKLQQDSQDGAFDAILHVGDFAYDLDSDNARVGDQFMRQVEPFAAYVPYMATVGNHEQAYNFSNYVNRFTMVDTRSKEINNHFYSYNIGPAHFISFSTEFYFFFEYGWSQLYTQFKWLEEDLIEATKPENRAIRPWIITLGHRPMYCNSLTKDDCTFRESRIRKGIPVVYELGLEDLFYKYGVDLEIWGHEHFYERLWPIYNLKVYNGSLDEPYTNPSAPVHITTGSAGCQEGLNPPVSDPTDWSAVRIEDYGFSRMKIHNRTHLTFEQLSVDQDHKIVDSITIIKDKHEPYPERKATHN